VTVAVENRPSRMPAAQRGNSSMRCAMATMVSALCGDTPVFHADQCRHRAGAGGAPQLVAVDLGDDVHDLTVDGVALAGQLRQLLEQPVQTLHRAHPGSERGCRRRHKIIKADRYD
jgi:hypothetical protein